MKRIASIPLLLLACHAPPFAALATQHTHPHNNRPHNRSHIHSPNQRHAPQIRKLQNNPIPTMMPTETEKFYLYPTNSPLPTPSTQLPTFSPTVFVPSAPTTYSPTFSVNKDSWSMYPTSQGTFGNTETSGGGGAIGGIGKGGGTYLPTPAGINLGVSVTASPTKSVQRPTSLPTDSPDSSYGNGKASDGAGSSSGSDTINGTTGSTGTTGTNDETGGGSVSSAVTEDSGAMTMALARSCMVVVISGVAVGMRLI